MAERRTRRLFGGALVLVGSVLLIATLFSPWYTYTAGVSSVMVGHGSTTFNSYPGWPTENGTIRCSSSGFENCPYSETSYQGAQENNTGTIAVVGYILLILGFVFGFLGAVLGLASRRDDRRARPALVLGIIAVLVAILVPVLFWGALPGALSKDIPVSERTTSSGPWSSFYGSSNSTPFAGVTVNLSWGPAIGWYLSFLAFAVLLVGVVLLYLNRRDPPESSSVSAPEPVSVPAPTPQAAPQAVPE